MPSNQPKDPGTYVAPVVENNSPRSSLSTPAAKYADLSNTNSAKKTPPYGTVESEVATTSNPSYGVALGVTLAVALGLALELALGVGLGVALGVALDVALGVALDVALAVALALELAAEGHTCISPTCTTGPVKSGPDIPL
jgi:hypothetical protein